MVRLLLQVQSQKGFFVCTWLFISPQPIAPNACTKKCLKQRKSSSIAWMHFPRGKEGPVFVMIGYPKTFHKIMSQVATGTGNGSWHLAPTFPVSTISIPAPRTCRFKDLWVSTGWNTCCKWHTQATRSHVTSALANIGQERRVYSAWRHSVYRASWALITQSRSRPLM